jgi:hypothetical protein
MTNQHPVTPPPDKIHNWLQLEKVDCTLGQIITIAAQWGADTELEACCEWLVSEGWFRYEHEAVQDLRAARRPKPPSLKEQALALINRRIGDGYVQMLTGADADTIRRAIEALPND